MKSAFPITVRTCLLALLPASAILADGDQLEAPVAMQQIQLVAPVKVAGKPEKPTEKTAAEKSEKKTEKKKTSKAKIFLTNGDQLHGQTLQIDKDNNLQFHSESLHQNASFPLKNVLSLNLDGSQPDKLPETLTRVTLQPRFSEQKHDTILGTLSELTQDSIKLDTWYGGEITLKRSMVQSLDVINNGAGSFFGPNNLDEWSLSEGKGSWNYHHGSLVSVTKGGIGRDVGLREKSHISFDASWEKTMRFRLQLYANAVGENSPSAYYDLNFNRNYAFLRTHGKVAKGVQRMGGGRWQQIKIPHDKTHARFDVFANRKLGTFTIYINGERACLLQSLNADPENLGSGLMFVAEDRYPVELSNIIVRPWNGSTLPQQNTIDAPEADGEALAEDDTKNKPPHTIQLNNGDEVPGTVGKVEGDRMVVETEFTPIRIPIKKIKSLSLGDTGEQPKMNTGDVRAWFHQGGFITLQLGSIQDGKISGYSQAVGDVSFDLKAFNRIDFDIYNEQANQLRKELR